MLALEPNRSAHYAGGRCVVPLVTMVGMVMAPGCSQPLRRAEIPLGEWQGQGVFVYQAWEANDQDGERPGETVSRHGRYPTRLNIRRATLAGEDIVRLEITSQRGALPELGAQTHLVVALSKVKTVSGSTTLYRVIDSLFNPDESDKLRSRAGPAPIGASCTTFHGAVVLQIHYHDGFVDVYRFADHGLLKHGSFFDPEQGLIHWTETLHRRK